MADLLRDGQALSYRTLLAVAEAIVSHRDWQGLFHDLAGRLQQVVGFDHLALLLHDAASDTLRLHLLESAEPLPAQPPKVTPVEGDPGGLVLQTQKPLILSTQAKAARWPTFLERVKLFGVHSFCFLPLTTARRRLGVLAFGSRQAGAYDAADLDFLQQVANQVAVAAENALAFEEIQALKDKLYQEKAYLEEEIPCHPVWRDSLFRHALIDSSLVRAERAAAL